jgi:hypothetical protein
MACRVRVVQQLGGAVMASGDRDGGAVQVMVAAVRRRQAELLQHLPQLPGGQAGADDRAMQVAVELPDLGAAGWLTAVTSAGCRVRPANSDAVLLAVVPVRIIDSSAGLIVDPLLFSWALLSCRYRDVMVGWT